jgi:deoxyribodipyrimidine photo-lyase
MPPLANPLSGFTAIRYELPDDIRSKWPAAVSSDDAPGGTVAARRHLDAFIETRLDRYAGDQRHPDLDGTSRLSPYLHWGHISAHEVFARVMRHEGWLGELPHKATGGREGWWGVSASADAFLDQLITWRELGFNMTSRRSEYDRYESLPAWARATLDAHADDVRDPLYELDTFERAATHDPLWNACQQQLVTEGRIHTYLRMLWGKKILEWSASPRDALAIMIHLNNKYALDGRDPNSYAGIFWVLGRYDRPWAPARDVFGSVRYMSSANTLRKLRVKQYLARAAKDAPLLIPSAL